MMRADVAALVQHASMIEADRRLVIARLDRFYARMHDRGLSFPERG